MDVTLYDITDSGITTSPLYELLITSTVEEDVVLYLIPFTSNILANTTVLIVNNNANMDSLNKEYFIISQF
jgi:hypothetical protein